MKLMTKPLTDVNVLANQKVAILGDVMLDRYLWGEVDRISPEAPVPVVHVTKRTQALGGAANVALNIKCLGGEPILVGAIGTDYNATIFKNLMFDNGLSAEQLVYTDKPTCTKSRIIARTQQVVRFDEEETDIVTNSLRLQLIESLKEAREQADVLILSDYKKGLIDQEIFDLISDLWKEGSIFVDPKPRNDLKYFNVHSMTPNLKETQELLGLDDKIKTDAQAESAAKNLVNTLGLSEILVTRSEKGMTLYEKAKDKMTHMPTLALEVAEVSGAGDTVIATYALAKAAGQDSINAMHLANLAGGVVVGKLGTATCSWDEIVEREQKLINEEA